MQKTSSIKLYNIGRGDIISHLEHKYSRFLVALYSIENPRPIINRIFHGGRNKKI
jgi:hypothetical protein